MNIGSHLSRKKISGRLYFQRAGADLLDLGNVLLVKQAHKMDRAQQVTASKGKLRVTHEEPAKADLKWEIKLDEQSGANLRLLHLAGAPTEVTQTASDENPLELTFADIGAQGFTSVIPAGAVIRTGLYHLAPSQVLLFGTEGTLLTEGVDWELANAPLGEIRFLTEQIMDYGQDPQPEDSAVVVYGEWPAGTFNRYTAISESFVRGTVQLDLLGNTGEETARLDDINLLATETYDLNDGGTAEVTVEPGASYYWEIGPDEVELDNISETLTDSGYFTAVSAVVAISAQGTSIGDPVGGSLKRAYFDVTAPFTRLTFAAELAVTEHGDADGSKFTEYTLTLTALSEIAVLERADNP